MNIIPQKLENYIKNLMNEEIIKVISDKYTTFFTNFLYQFDSNKYVSAMLNLQQEIYNSLAKIISNIIEKIDNYYACSVERKSKFYISKKAVSRTIITIYGELNFKRNYYVYKDKKNGFFFIDKLLGLDKYFRYDPVVRGLLIDDAVHTNMNKASTVSSKTVDTLLNFIKNSNNPSVPRQTIATWIKRWKNPKVKYGVIDNDKDLYVMVDEKYIHQQKDEANDGKKHFIMSKCFVVFTGIKVTKKRSKLLNRHIFITSSKTPWKDLMDEIASIYDFEKIDTINLLSDAGGWILANANELKLYTNNKIVINTCEFHVKQKINRFTCSKELRHQLSEAIYDKDDKSLFLELANNYLADIKDEKKKVKKQEYIDYIIKHWKSIQNMTLSPIKSSMESHISHCVAEHFGSRPKGYSANTIERYLKLQEYKLNGINIFDLYLQTYFKSEDDLPHNENKLDFSIFEKSSSCLPCLYTSSNVGNAIKGLAFSVKI